MNDLNLEITVSRKIRNGSQVAKIYRDENGTSVRHIRTKKGEKVIDSYHYKLSTSESWVGPYFSEDSACAAALIAYERTHAVSQ